jgi:hypothetical protein
MHEERKSHALATQKRKPHNFKNLLRELGSMSGDFSPSENLSQS